MAAENKALKVKCDSCRKTMIENTILRHIGNSKSCRKFYGTRYEEMKKKKGREKVAKHRLNKKSFGPEHEDQLRKMRELYANNQSMKDRKRKNYEKNKQQRKEKNEKETKEYLSFIAEKRKEKISNLEISPTILYKSIEKFEELEKVFKVSVILCDFCKGEFAPNSILVHIGKSVNCKSYYGEKYDNMKLVKNEITRKNNLEKKKERYEKDPVLREKMKKSSKIAHKKLQEKIVFEREKERKEKRTARVKFSKGYFDKKGRGQNSVWKKKMN